MYTKNEWRSVLLRRRRQVEASVRSAYSSAIARRLRDVPEFRLCGTLVSYRAMGAEVDPASLIAEARGAGKRVCLVPSTGWRNPPGDSPSVERASLGRNEGAPRFVVVPGVGFDLSGVRLGRGGGYFDRVLEQLRRAGRVLVVGAAFEAQVVTALPWDPWDQSVDLIATERRLIVPRRADAGCDVVTTEKGDDR